MDRLIVSLDLALPVDAGDDPIEPTAMLAQVANTLRQVYGIEVKHTAGIVAESVYDENVEGPDDGGKMPDQSAFGVDIGFVSYGLPPKPEAPNA